jgi:putative CocE/NonD family hydrolase
MIPSRDDVHLASDIYRPACEGEALLDRFPTILLRTSYNKKAQRYVEIADFVTVRGYVVVSQDFRGRYRSEGTGQYFHTANPHEGRDGYDTVEWIASQPWSNGRVGTVGSSHPGLAQLHMALYRPPHLTAIWPDATPINSYDHQVRQGGAMQLHMFGALFIHALEAQEVQNDPAAQQSIISALEQMRDLVYSTPFKPDHTPLSVAPNLEKTLFDYYNRGDYDEYWSAEYNDFQRHFDRHADIPGTYTSGWFDPYAVAAVNYYARMAKQNTTPQRLIIGPWTHMAMRTNLSYANDVDFGSASVWGKRRYHEEQLRWFERWLRNVPNGIEDEVPVQIFVMGGGDGRRADNGKLRHGSRWRQEFEWPLARTEYHKYYLRAGGGLSRQQPDRGDPPASYQYDPDHPIPTLGGTVTGFFEIVPLRDTLDPFWSQFLSPWARMCSVVPDGPMHQQEQPNMIGTKPPYLPLAARPDVLVFQTPPLENDIEVTGAVEVALWVSSSASDTDFTAKLIDVYPPNTDYPNGYHMNLADSIIRYRYQYSFEQAELMEPGQIYQVKFVLPPTSNIYQAGHRIRIDVSSSNFPRFDLNPNTGEHMGRHTHSVVARNTVYLGRDHPSYGLFPSSLDASNGWAPRKHGRGERIGFTF